MQPTGNTKEIIALIKKLELDPVVEKNAEDFLESYDGTNTKELHAFMLDYVLMLMNKAVIENKAKGLERVAEIHENFNIKMEKLKESFNRITNNQPTVAPFDSTN